MELKKIALDQIHENLGAKMVPFAGFNMPVSYSSLMDEHQTVRNGVGVFDVSHMGEFFLEGEGALNLIQRVCSNDASKIEIGGAQYSCLPNDTGGIVDDLLIYRLAENNYMLVVNASNIEKDWEWIKKQNTNGVSMTNRSDEYSLLAVQGPKAVETLQKITDEDLAAVKFYSFINGRIGGVDNVIISATGYTGSGGFELYIPNAHAETLWKKIFEAGEESGIKPIGLGARDTLRMEMGYCLYGNDITDTTSPIEAGLGWITKFNKEFINSEFLQKQKEEGISKKLVSFVMEERGIPRQHYTICDENGNTIGEVTSGTQSPSLGQGIGMGYVLKEFSRADTPIWIEIRNKHISATVKKSPLIRP